MPPADTTKPDFVIANHGSILIFIALSKEAQDHADIMFADAQTWGRNGYVVEPRYAQPIIDDLIECGFNIN
jgi:hypothetical protein